MNAILLCRAPVLCAFLTLLVAAPAMAQETPEREAIETIVRDYLLREPEVLLEALNALEDRRTAEAETQQRDAIAAAGDDLARTPDGTALGNPEGDVTVVEFFDYNCGFCRRAHADMQALIEDDPNLRFVLKEAPVLGPQSEDAARVSLAVREVAPDRYAEFQSALISGETVADEAVALGVAEDLGLAAAEVREAMDGPAVESALQESARLLAALNITGTPSYVVGGELIPGAIGAAGIAERIANVRECGSATC